MGPAAFGKAQAVLAESSGTQLLACRYRIIHQGIDGLDLVRNVWCDKTMQHAQIPSLGPNLSRSDRSRLACGKFSQALATHLILLRNRETKNLTARQWTNRRIICLIRRLCRQVATPMSLHSLFEAHQLLFGGGCGKGQNPSSAPSYPQAVDVELNRWNRWRKPQGNA